MKAIDKQKLSVRAIIAGVSLLTFTGIHAQEGQLSQQPAGKMNSVTIETMIAEAPSTVNAKYVEVSSTQKLPPEYKIKDLFNLNKNGNYVLQRLTDRTYFFQKNYYATTFYVGDKGVLLFDPLENHGPFIQKAIASVTSLPVTAIVYSHDHADHIGDVGLFTEAAKRLDKNVRIIASGATVEKMNFLNARFPEPTEIIDWPSGHFMFENLRVDLYGFVHAAHTTDHSAWMLVQEKVLHAPDLLNPDQPPFWQFGGFENYVFFESNLNQVSGLDYLFVNGGHGNIGSKADFNFYNKFLNDLKNAVRKEMTNTKFGEGVDDPAHVNAHTAFLPNYIKTIGKKAAADLRPEYGKFYGYDYATPDNAQMVAMALFAYKDFSTSNTNNMNNENTLEKNKELVRSFYELGFNQHRPAEAVKKYMSDNYIQHHPGFKDGHEDFIKNFEAYFKKFPNVHLEFIHLVAEGDLVTTHIHSKHDKDDRGTAIMDIFRIENGRIAEHWDVMQEVPAPTPGTNGMFR